MWRALAVLFVLSAAGQSELRRFTPVLELPAWADPAPREIPGTPLLDPLPEPEWTVVETPFSDISLAAILSSNLPNV